MKLLLIWTQMVAMIVFLAGFLPVKEPLNKQPQEIPPEIKSQWLRRKVGQVVLVVIDALRADFVFKRSDNELHEHFHENQEKSFVAFANSPTVTMPRIKALMSGTIPGFVDVVLNFGSTRFQGDNLIDQWSKNDRNLTMYGDDTWLKLFPDRFMRYDGTSSFFVADFTEVDDNVTRHLDSEMDKNDWDVCVLHYLGLDHIGHLTGPKDPRIGPKLDEMGQVVEFLKNRLIHEKKWILPPLIIVLGDHGMADAGGHGGSSEAEIQTPMLFITPLNLTRKSRNVKQVDLAPTLAWLTGVPIPMESLGRLMFKEPGEKAEKYNKMQIAQVVNGDENDDIEILLEKYQENLTEYNVPMLIFGISLALATCLKTLFDLKNGFGIVDFVRILHILSFLSTSFIEEEHQSIYFFSMTILAFLTLKEKTYHGFLAMFLLRLARIFNQTGDKWSHVPGINEDIKANHILLVVSFSLSLAILALFTYRKISFVYILVFIQKWAEINSEKINWPAQIVYAISLICVARHLMKLELEKVAISILLFLSVITPPHNLILLAIHLILESQLSKLTKDLNIYYFFGWSLFFHMGNSNGLASIDVGSAYVGISSFNPWLVGSLLAVSTFSGPILWCFWAFSRGIQLNPSFVFYRGAEITFYLMVVMIHRHHLFVWTVFSPKLLYFNMAVLVINILYSIFVPFYSPIKS